MIKKTAQLLTTAQKFSIIVKSVREIMRKDKGFSGDGDHLARMFHKLGFWPKFSGNVSLLRELKRVGQNSPYPCEMERRQAGWLLKVAGREVDSRLTGRSQVRKSWRF